METNIEFDSPEDLPDDLKKILLTHNRFLTKSIEERKLKDD